MRDHTFIETASGRRFQPLAPIVGDIFPEDIAHALGHQCRFAGHVHTFYSVAEHCVRVAGLLERWGCSHEVILWGLLHDASEAYLVDIPLPLKRHPDFEAYRVAEARMMAAVCERFGLPEQEPDAVKRADAVLLATEARDLMPYRYAHWQALTEKALPERIEPWAPSTAQRNWLRRFQEIGT